MLTEIQYFVSSICREITASKMLSSAFSIADIQVASSIVYSAVESGLEVP